LSSALLSQNAVLDSLKNEISIQTQKDSNRVKLLNLFAFKNYGTNQDLLKKYAEEAQTLAKEIGFLNGEARSWYLLSIFNLTKGDLNNASITINQSLSLYEKNGNQIGISSCYDLLGTLSNFKEDYDQSIVYYNKALKIAKDKGDQLKAAGFISNIGGTYSRKGDFDIAVALYHEAIEIFDTLNVREKTLNPLNNIALTYTRQGRNTEALAYFQKCLSGYREYGNKIFGSSILLNMGLIYINIGENNKALPYILEALEINKELGNELEISKNLIALGNIYNSKRENKKALNYYKDALLISEKIGSKEGKYNSYSNMGSLNLERNEFKLALSNFKKGLEVSLALGGKRLVAESYVALGATYYGMENYRTALEHLQKGIVIADELSILKTQEKANLYLSKVYEKNNNYKDALIKFRLYKAQSDSLLNRENIRKITQIEYDYKYKQRLDSASSRELKLTNTVNTTSQELEKSQRNLLLGVIAFLLMAIILGAIIFFQKLRNAKSKTQNIAIEQKLLRSQMTPHFIFNALSVLQGIILNKEEEKAVSYLSKFSKLLRIILENSRDKTVLLSQELAAVENYLSLQDIEGQESFQFKINVGENIDQAYFNIPPMLIQPFIENAIEHAFGEEKENRKIDIHLTYIDKKLICTITDNGIGIIAQKESKKEFKKSLATTITSERLKLLSKDFKTLGSIRIEDRKKHNERGTIVTLVIPYKTNVTL